MLHNKDFIMRLIEQLSRALDRIMNELLSRPEEDLGVVEAELNGIAHRAGLDLELAHRLSIDSLAVMVAPGGDPDPSRCWLLAELLFLRGLGEERRGETESARESRLRSLYLYRLVQPEWRSEIDLPEPAARIAVLEARINSPPSTD